MKISTKQNKQAGVTLIEIMVVIAIISVIGMGAAIGYNTLQKTKGANEGKIIATALSCGQGAVSGPSFASTTLPTLANKDCFPADLTTNRGLATAAATSSMNNTVYVVTPVNLAGVNDGLQISLAGVPGRNCTGMVDQLNATSAKITVTAAGGAAVIVKPVGGLIDDDAVGTSCNSAATATVAAAVGRS